MYYHLIRLYSASIPRYAGVILVLLIFTGYGCKKDKEIDFQPGTNEFVNKWILDSMKVYYYWNKNLPGNPDYFQEPLNFFSSIRNSADRFSELVNPAIPSTYQQTMSNNFGIDLLAVENRGETELYVSLVVPGSFAARSGLVRGQRVLTVNGTTADAGNVARILQNCLDIKTAELMIEGLPSAVRLTSTRINENPVHLYKLLGTGGKTGYLFLNRFEVSNAAYLLDVISYFKNAGITGLIIDLRYNPGGDVSMAALLAALVAPVGGSDIFAEYRGNNNAGTKRNSFDKELSYINKTVGELDAFRLNLNKVYILTGHHTVSSAELLINSLRPYADVVQIGERTTGKDMAAFVIEDNHQPSLSGGWILHPLVYKLYNMRGEGDYTDGLSPDIAVNELTVLPLKPPGDEADPLIAAALARATTSSVISLKLPKASGTTAVKAVFETRTATDKSAQILLRR